MSFFNQYIEAKGEAPVYENQYNKENQLELCLQSVEN